MIQELRQWLMTANSLDHNQVILANQSTPRPAGDYLTVEIVEQGIASFGQDVSETTRHFRGEGVFEIVACGRGAYAWLSTAYMYFFTPAGQSMFADFSFSPMMSLRGIRKFPMVGTGLEHRTIWNLPFIFNQVLTVQEGIVIPTETVTFESDFGETESTLTVEL